MRIKVYLDMEQLGEKYILNAKGEIFYQGKCIGELLDMEKSPKTKRIVKKGIDEWRDARAYDPCEEAGGYVIH